VPVSDLLRFNGTLIDHEGGNVEDAQRIVTAGASSFVSCADRLASLTREKGEETHDTSSRRHLVQRREGDDGERANHRREHFCQN
jgi:hypothetical protein